MKKLWAPWRGRYLRLARKEKGCFLCRAVREKKDRANHVIHRTGLSFCVLNLYPYNNGHLMVAPKRHVGNLDRMTTKEREDFFDLLLQSRRAVKRLLLPEGFNIGINEGKAAGAGVAGHLHFHIVPRWEGDTNFMPVLADTKVIAESLASLHQKLKAVFS